MSILCTICARGKSKGVTNKALRLLNNKPLIAYTVEQALDSKVFDRVVASTDSKIIAEKAKTNIELNNSRVFNSVTKSFQTIAAT